MELWIRSQSKRNLMKAEDIVAADNRIEIYKQNEDSTTVGEYKSDERALEVLDEIQNIFKPQMIISKVGKPIVETCSGTLCEPDEYDIKEISTYVYEMPED